MFGLWLKGFGLAFYMLKALGLATSCEVHLNPKPENPRVGSGFLIPSL